ncbi:MAG: guanine deaminase [Gammaproteobacteria bacterium]|nr:guanine deaminase [Gammaproteobacteria bacterium]
MSAVNAIAIRGTLLDCPAVLAGAPASARVVDDGLVVIADGLITYAGAYDVRRHAHARCMDLRGKLILPGLVDVHTHFAQTEMIAAYGEQLLDWLEKYTFPTESEFADFDHATRVAKLFVSELIRNGTTTAAVYGTVHPASVDAIAHVGIEQGMQLIIGKVMMDRNCPQQLRDTAESAYVESKVLIERWHHVERLGYAITPRFAPTSSEAQLDAAAALWDEFPDVYLQTHVAENEAEVRWVRELFPQARSYLDVYARHNLLRPRTVLGHCIHMDSRDRDALCNADATIAYCPSSNSFLGSGLFDLDAARRTSPASVQRLGIGTDVGAGTSFSVFRTLGEAYKVAQLRGQSCTPAEMLYHATLGGAHSLHLEDKIGSLVAGKYADIVVLDPHATPLSSARAARCADPLEQWFALCMIGDDRHVSETYIRGQLAHATADVSVS